VGDPRLRLSSSAEPLDTLEVDEADAAGRVEMRNPWEAVLLVSSDIVEAGAVSYALAASAGLFWEITVSGDDGVLPPSSDTVFLFSGLDASVDGNTVGVVDPRFTPETVGHSVTASGLALQIGAHAVTLDVAGSLAWSPASGPALAAGQAAPMPTGDASTAGFTGTLHTPFGAVPFDVGLADHLGADMALTNFSVSPPDDHPWLRLTSAGGSLDTLEIDEGDVPGRVDMRNPYRALLGTSGGVTWSISARLFFNDTFHDRVPSPPNGAARDVSWTLRSEVLFNDVFYASDPSVLPGSIPALGPAGRGLLAALLLGAALCARRLREG
jgi:hypothetical protein